MSINQILLLFLLTTTSTEIINAASYHRIYKENYALANAEPRSIDAKTASKYFAEHHKYPELTASDETFNTKIKNENHFIYIAEEIAALSNELILFFSGQDKDLSTVEVNLPPILRDIKTYIKENLENEKNKVALLKLFEPVKKEWLTLWNTIAQFQNYKKSPADLIKLAQTIQRSSANKLFRNIYWLW